MAIALNLTWLRMLLSLATGSGLRGQCAKRGKLLFDIFYVRANHSAFLYLKVDPFSCRRSFLFLWLFCGRPSNNGHFVPPWEFPMLIDWLTLRLDRHRHDDPEFWSGLLSRVDRIFRTTGSGVLVWETSAWDSIRSDTHGLSYRVTPDALWLQGSPARCSPSGDAVFGPGHVNVVRNAAYMLDFARDILNVQLPGVEHWACTRIDITENYLLPTENDVNRMLDYIRGLEGGRQKVHSINSTVYLGGRSRLRRGKCYAKGAHLAYLTKKAALASPDSPPLYSVSDISLVRKLLRLELTLGAQYLREKLIKPWYMLTSSELAQMHTDFFSMMWSVEMPDINHEYLNILENSGSQSLAKSVYRTWALIKSEGYHVASRMISKSVWYRHRKILLGAGFSMIDLSNAHVVPIRIIHPRPVTSWDELRNVA